MKFEIPFNRQIAESQYRLIFKQAWEKNLRSIKRNFIYGVIVVALMSTVIGGKHIITNVLLGFGCCLLLTSVEQYIVYLRRKSRSLEDFSAFAERRELVHSISIWEFSESHFRNRELWYDQAFEWAAFKDYKLLEGNLLMTFRENQGQRFVLGELELGQEAFRKVIEFVRSRVAVAGEPEH